MHVYIYMHLHIDICVEHQLDSVGNAKGDGFDHRIWTLLLDTCNYCFLRLLQWRCRHGPQRWAMILVTSSGPDTYPGALKTSEGERFSIHFQSPYLGTCSGPCQINKDRELCAFKSRSGVCRLEEILHRLTETTAKEPRAPLLILKLALSHLWVRWCKIWVNWTHIRKETFWQY